jgi:hypothetical protein
MYSGTSLSAVLVVVGDTLYCADGTANILTFDIADLATPGSAQVLFAPPTSVTAAFAHNNAFIFSTSGSVTVQPAIYHTPDALTAPSIIENGRYIEKDRDVFAAPNNALFVTLTDPFHGSELFLLHVDVLVA